MSDDYTLPAPSGQAGIAPRSAGDAGNPVKRFCNGLKFDPRAAPPSTIRIDGDVGEPDRLNNRSAGHDDDRQTRRRTSTSTASPTPCRRAHDHAHGLRRLGEHSPEPGGQPAKLRRDFDRTARREAAERRIEDCWPMDRCCSPTDRDCSRTGRGCSPTARRAARRWREIPGRRLGAAGRWLGAARGWRATPVGRVAMLADGAELLADGRSCWLTARAARRWVGVAREMASSSWPTGRCSSADGVDLLADGVGIPRRRIAAAGRRSPHPPGIALVSEPTPQGGRGIGNMPGPTFADRLRHRWSGGCLRPGRAERPLTGVPDWKAPHRQRRSTYRVFRAAGDTVEAGPDTEITISPWPARRRRSWIATSCRTATFTYVVEAVLRRRGEP